MEKSRAARLIFLAVVIGALLVLGKSIAIDEKLNELKNWIVTLGRLGPLVFVGLYIVATVAMLPGSGLTIAGGALFGAVWGVVWVIIAATVGASAAFLIARYVARGAVQNWLGRHPGFQKLDMLTREQGSIIVAITRLVPLFPFNLLNYGFGLTAVPIGTYVLWSFLCMLPGTVLYVAGTDAIVVALREGRIPWMLVATVVCVLSVISYLTILAKKRLQ